MSETIIPSVYLCDTPKFSYVYSEKFILSIRIFFIRPSEFMCSRIILEITKLWFLCVLKITQNILLVSVKQRKKEWEDTRKWWLLDSAICSIQNFYGLWIYTLWHLIFLKLINMWPHGLDTQNIIFLDIPFGQLQFQEWNEAGYLF